MKTFKDYLIESNVDVTIRHESARGRLRSDGESLYLSHVRSGEQNKGHGSGLMHKVNDYADKHKKTVKLVAVADRDEDEPKLHKFYHKHGYKHKPGTPYMVRDPK